VKIEYSKTADALYDPKTHRPNLAGTIPPARMAEVERALRLVLHL
jgi:hypothetical protein